MADKLMAEIQEDFLTCSICLKPYQQPRALPCLHSFCTRCLEIHIENNAVKAGTDGVKCIFCPMCRQVVEVPKAGVAGFQDNHLASSLLDMVYARVLQTCEVCREEGKHNAASFCCIKCEDFLCQECANTHKRTRVTRDHLVINVSMMKDMCLEKHADKKICVRLLTKIGSFGPDLNNPCSIAINQADDIIVANNNDKISVFNQAGECKKVLDQRLFYGTETNFLPSRGVGITTEGFIGVAMRKDFTSGIAYVGVVQTLAGRQAGLFAVKTRSGKDCIPHGIAITPDNYTIITDVGKHCFYIFNPDMDNIKQVGKLGSRSSQFKSPFYVAVNKSRQILISDYDNHCIKIFDMRGKFVKSFGEMGRELGQLMHPMGLCTDSDNNIFVCDRDNHRVQMFDADGKFITVICQNTCRDGNDVRPQDIAMTTNGHVAVLVKGIEGVNFSEIHILQVGTRFSEPERKKQLSEANQQLKMLRTSLDMARKNNSLRQQNVLPPITNKMPSAPPDLLNIGGRNLSARNREGESDGGFPNFNNNTNTASSLCNIL